MPKTSQPTYHPITFWKCSDCKAEGEVHYPVGTDCSMKWDLVVEDHSKISPQCSSTKGVHVREAEPMRIPE